MNKHTPAPWKHHNYTIYHGGLKVARIPNLRAIGKRQASDHEEEQANARLIAAAPELLSALEALFENCVMIHKYGGSADNTKEADEAINAARAAIQNATR